MTLPNPSGQAPRALSNGDSRRILIVDDNPDILDVFRTIFVEQPCGLELDSLEAELFGTVSVGAQSEMNFIIDTASQGYEGYQKVSAALEAGRPYDLVFVDMRMPPGWDGVETITHMLEKDAQLEVAVCSAYSDYGMEDILKRTQRPDMKLLYKPFTSQQVLQLARELSDKCLRRRQEQRPVPE